MTTAPRNLLKPTPMTHHHWRPTLGAMSLALLAGASAPTQAAPDAGQLLQQLQPAPRVPPAPDTAPLQITRPTAEPVPEGGPVVIVQGFRLEGVTALPESELQALLAPAIGQTASFAELQRLCARLTQHYQQAGYLMARAYLPTQQIADGQVRVALIEGRLGEIRLGANTLGGQALAPLQNLRPGAVLRESELVSTLLALRELPGVQLQSALRPGQTPGTADLLVEVQPGRSFSGDVQLDNAGNGSTGEYRAIASLALNNPLQLGDQLSLRALASDGRQHYLMAAYQLPVDAQAARVGVSISQMSYTLGHRFAALQASGQARTLSLYLKHALHRGLDRQVTALLQLDAKHLNDQIDSTGTRTDTRLLAPSISLQTAWQDAWAGLEASSQLSLGASMGRVSLDPTSEALDTVGAQQGRGFSKWSLSGQRAQGLGADWTLLLTGRAQTSPGNLPSSEKLGLGGAQAVRAYADGEALGDRGWQGSIELQWQVQPAWRLQAFVDAGEVQLNALPWDASVPNRRRLAGGGGGVQWHDGAWSASLAVAWPLGSGAGHSDPQRRPRAWATAGWAF